jgi:hypothetical protein
MHFGGLIFVAGGLYVLLAVFGVVTLSKNLEANEQWLLKFGRMMKVMSPIAILYGLGEIFGLFP